MSSDQHAGIERRVVTAYAWVNNELNGYKDGEDVPEYRVVSTAVRGNVANIAWQQTDTLIPISRLPQDMQDSFATSKMQASIDSITEIVRSYRQEGKALAIPFSPEMCVYLQKGGLAQGVNVLSAWRALNMIQVENVVIQVRSRLQEFCLELRSAIGNSTTDLPKKADEVGADKMFQAAIYGGTNTFVVGSSNVQSVTTSVIKNDIDTLMRAMSELGITPLELEELKTAVLEDQRQKKIPNINDGKTSTWYWETMKKAGRGTYKVGVDVAAGLIGKLIKDYVGT